MIIGLQEALPKSIALLLFDGGVAGILQATIDTGCLVFYSATTV